ncbi:MAG TPA: ATP-binding protein [Solirubrobacterales bacterium]|nr:ATP-binding protein [Solirubrobacterales bacterium]
MRPRVTPPRNPFRYGALALDEAFADREEEVQELKFDVLNGQDVVVFAPRRFGKSSLVWRAMQELVGQGALVAYVNLMTTPTKEKLAERLAAAIYEEIASPVARVRERSLAPFRGLRISPTITVDPENGGLSFSFGIDHAAPDVDATLERLLELPAELSAGDERPVALVFDEFQEVELIDRALPKLMRTIFEQQPEIARVYLGSRRHLMERLFNDENEPFWRSAKKVELGLIAPERFRGFIGERFRATRKDIEPAVVDAVLGRTRGHPYATQELCYFLWEQTPFDGAATAAELDAAADAVLRSEDTHFAARWDDASAVQKLILGALAHEPGRPMTKEYRARHGLPSVSAIQAALRALVDRELVLRVPDGSYRIAEPFMDEWLRRL